MNLADSLALAQRLDGLRERASQVQRHGSWDESKPWALLALDAIEALIDLEATAQIVWALDRHVANRERLQTEADREEQRRIENNARQRELNAVAIEVECPWCGRGKGLNCVTTNQVSKGIYHHAVRLQAARGLA